MESEQGLSDQQKQLILKGRLYEIKLGAQQNYQILVKTFHLEYNILRTKKEVQIMLSEDKLSMQLNIPEPFQYLFLSDLEFLQSRLLENRKILNKIDSQTIYVDSQIQTCLSDINFNLDVFQAQFSEVYQIIEINVFTYQIVEQIEYLHVINDKDIFEFQVQEVIVYQKSEALVDKHIKIIMLLIQEKEDIVKLQRMAKKLEDLLFVSMQSLQKIQKTQISQLQSLQLRFIEKVVPKQRLSQTQSNQTQSKGRMQLYVTPLKLQLRKTSLLSSQQEAQLNRIQREISITPRLKTARK